MTPASRARLRGIVAREIESPGDPDRFFREIEEAFPDLVPAVRLWRLKDEDHRTSFYVKSESVWYRRFGFRMMRPLFALAIVAAVLIVVTDRYTDVGRYVDPTFAFAFFLAGAFGFYAILQLFAHHWAAGDLRKLSAARDRYRQRLERFHDEIEQEK